MRSPRGRARSSSASPTSRRISILAPLCERSIARSTSSNRSPRPPTSISRTSSSPVRVEGFDEERQVLVGRRGCRRRADIAPVGGGGLGCIRVRAEPRPGVNHLDPPADRHRNTGPPRRARSRRPRPPWPRSGRPTAGAVACERPARARTGGEWRRRESSTRTDAAARAAARSDRRSEGGRPAVPGTRAARRRSGAKPAFASANGQADELDRDVPRLREARAPRRGQQASARSRGTPGDTRSSARDRADRVARDAGVAAGNQTDEEHVDHRSETGTGGDRRRGPISLGCRRYRHPDEQEAEERGRESREGGSGEGVDQQRRQHARGRTTPRRDRAAPRRAAFRVNRANRASSTASPTSPTSAIVAR